MKTKSQIKQFTVKSGKIVISDPCYDRKTWCAHFNIPALNGEWNGFINYSKEDRVSSVVAYHNLYKFDLKNSKRIDEIGVDSGQAGIFDDDIYPSTSEEIGEYGNLSSFYGKCCQATLNEDFGIINSGGIVSRSGYGDGVYSAFLNRVDDKVVAVKIKFI